jgi:hypothetical protein
MPKNFGLGVTVRTTRNDGRALVRLARRELWQRLDRGMLARSRGDARARLPDQPVR